MTNLLVKFFIKNPDQIKDKNVREAYGILVGCVGIVANLLLSGAKFLIGILSGSIAIQADAVNNFADMGSSIVTLIGFKAANKPADRTHPYGYARLEYISAMIIAFIVLLIGFELGKESVMKIISPTPVTFNLVTIIVLLLSIGVKFWMSRFTSEIGRRIESKTMTAATTDNICDVVSTGAILISTVIGYFNQINIDGYIGVLVAGFVLYSGIGIIKDTIGPLMGEAPDPELVRQLSERLIAYDGVLALHDIIIHNYGPDRHIATAHVVVSADENIMELHEKIDLAEREIAKDMGLLLTLHIDPVETNNEVVNRTRDQIAPIVASFEDNISFHDFRMVYGEKHCDLLFDIVVPPNMKPERIEQIKSVICNKALQINPTYHCIIGVDIDYTGNR